MPQEEGAIAPHKKQIASREEGAIALLGWVNEGAIAAMIFLVQA